jgi:hypothetical protein
MRNSRLNAWELMTNTKTLRMLALMILISCTVAMADTAADVTGTWNVQVSGDEGSASQTIILKQDENQIAGTFKGPRQSGNSRVRSRGTRFNFM